MTKFLKGYIINSTPYKENDLIISLLTIDGITSFKVRGGLKIPNKFYSYIQLYTYGEYEIYYKNEGDNTKALRDGKILDIIPSILTNLKAYTILSFIAESIIKDGELENIYEMFDNCFKLVKSDKFDIANIALVMLKYHLYYNGSYLENDRCVKCGKTNNIVTVSFNEGGYICDLCNSDYHLQIRSEEYLLGYRYIMKAKFKDTNSFSFTNETKLELLNDMFHVVEENCGLRLKSKSMILNIV